MAQKRVIDLFSFNLETLPDDSFIEGSSVTNASGETVTHFRKQLEILEYGIFDVIEVIAIGKACKNISFVSYDLDKLSMKNLQRLVDDLFFILGPDQNYKGKFNDKDRTEFTDTYNLFDRSWTDSKNKYPASLYVAQEINSITLTIWGIGME